MKITITPRRTLILILLLSLPLCLAAAEQSANLEGSVPAGGTHTTRLKNLPQNTHLTIGIEITGTGASIYLAKEKPISTKRQKEWVIYASRVDGKTRFELQIPESANYHLVIDNREALVAKEFKLSIKAAIAEDKISQNYRELQKLEDKLREYFKFDNIVFSIRRCNTANAFTDDRTIIICQEIGDALAKKMQDKKLASDVLTFIVMHEIGHALLKQWGYPFFDNEEVADEFATAMLVMFNQAGRARTQAEFFSRISSDSKRLHKNGKYDRHPLSAQRARNILKWLGDRSLVKRWQRIFVPHFQTPILKQMQASATPWVDRELVTNELNRRK